MSQTHSSCASLLYTEVCVTAFWRFTINRRLVSHLAQLPWKTTQIAKSNTYRAAVYSLFKMIYCDYSHDYINKIIRLLLFKTQYRLHYSCVLELREYNI